MPRGHLSIRHFVYMRKEFTVEVPYFIIRYPALGVRYYNKIA